MTSQNYKRTIFVNADANKAYWALTEGIHKWWTKPDIPMKKIGDRSKFTFLPGQSYWTFEATALAPAQLVEMTCVDAYHLHDGQPKEIETEWLNTRVCWSIHSHDKETEITIEHHGLVPDLHCYKICEAGWDMFFLQSLKDYLNTGIGRPHITPLKETDLI